jgi:hypothetical protein
LRRCAEDPPSEATPVRQARKIHDRSATGRDDKQLEAVLDASAWWIVKGYRGAILGRAQSLREAVHMSVEIADWGADVVAVVRGAEEEIIVYAAQLQRLFQTCGATSKRDGSALPQRRPQLLKARKPPKGALVNN